MQNKKIAQEIRTNIQNLVNRGALNEAKLLLDEYKKLDINDIDIYSIDAVMFIMENKLKEAEMCLVEGIAIDKSNFDLFYNLGYLYEIQGRKIEALSAYTIAKLLSNNNYNKRITEEKISNLRDKKINTYNVILCGKMQQCTDFEQIFKGWNIVGYVAYEKSNIHNQKVLQISEIPNYKYDFIIILDEDNESIILEQLIKRGINNNIYLYSNFKISVIEGVDYRIRELLHRNNIEIFITGSSYVEVGIKTEQLNKNSINFAFSSQDLFYDYHIANYLLNYAKIKASIKYAILGLSYYCFDYDLSKSIGKYRIHRYLNYIQDFHNNEDEIGIYITKMLYEKRIGFKEYYNMNKIKENTIVKYQDECQEYVAKKNSTMDYIFTRKENLDILYKYLNLLKVNNIKPIIVICPTSKYYYKYFDNSYQKDKFYKILNELEKEFEFQILDYFDSDLFEDNDFWDYGHLNGRGAIKFTKILNDNIKW